MSAPEPVKPDVPQAASFYVILELDTNNFVGAALAEGLPPSLLCFQNEAAANTVCRTLCEMPDRAGAFEVVAWDAFCRPRQLH